MTPGAAQCRLSNKGGTKMNTIGPVVGLPWGLALYVVIACAIAMIISEIVWVVMKHFPEDDLNWSFTPAI